MMEITANPYGLHRTKCHYKGGIGKAKVKYPSPGSRGMFFQLGTDRFVTHFDRKGDHDHDHQIALGQQARDEHKARMTATQQKKGKK